MHHFFSGYYFLELKNEQAYIDELAFAHGEPGRDLGQRIIAGMMGNVWESEIMLEFHMAKAALHGCLGVVTHSEFARREIESFAAYPVIHIDFPTPKVSSKSGTQASINGKIRFLSFGMLNSNKMIDRVIEAISASPILREHVIYNIIGTGNEDYTKRLQQRIQQQQLEGRVNLLGYQTNEVLQRHIQEADVIVNLRNPHFGESSWVLLETAFSAKPTVVWKHGYYDEYPNETVIKVTDATLLPSLEQAATDEALRRRLSKAVRAYAEQTFSTEGYSQQLLSFIDEARRQQPIFMLADKMSHYIQELDPKHPILPPQVAREIANLLPNR